MSVATTVSYQRSKGNIVGPRFKEPFIGPFLQSMNPKWEEYYGKWTSGPLSCVSVFHKYAYTFPHSKTVTELLNMVCILTIIGLYSGS